MLNVLVFVLNPTIAFGCIFLLGVRSLLVKPEYLNGLLRFVRDPEVKEYFVYRFPSENQDSIQAVASRRDLLLLEDAARILRAPDCLDFGELIEKRVAVIDVGNPPHGAEFLSECGWASSFAT